MINISITSMRRICLFLSLAFSLRFILSDWVWRDRFNRICRRVTSARLFPLWMFIALAVLFIVTKVRWHLAFRDSALDYSLYQYALFNTLKGSFMYTPFLKQCYFAMHFSPIILTSLPFYALIPSGYTLLSWQAALLASAVIPAFYLARSVWNDSASATAFALCLTTMFAFGAMLKCDFHQEAAYPALILLSILALEKERPILFLLSLLALWTVKEDAQIYTAMLSIGAICYRRWWKVGILGIALSVLVWVLVVYVIMPAFGGVYGPSEILANRWGEYGDTFWEILIWFVTHPLQSAGTLLLPEATRFLTSFLLTSLFSPWVLAVIPQLVVNASSTMTVQHDLTAYFAAPIATLSAVAAVYGIRRLSCWGFHLKLDRRKIITVLAMGIMIINIGHIDILKTDPQVRVVHSILAHIPQDASFSAQDHIIPYIPPHNEFYLLPEWRGAEYIFIDTGNVYVDTGLEGTSSRVDAMFLVKELTEGDDYELVKRSGDGSSFLMDGGEKSTFDRFYLFKGEDDGT